MVFDKNKNIPLSPKKDLKSNFLQAMHLKRKKKEQNINTTAVVTRNVYIYILYIFINTAIVAYSVYGI